MFWKVSMLKINCYYAKIYMHTCSNWKKIMIQKFWILKEKTTDIMVKCTWIIALNGKKNNDTKVLNFKREKNRQHIMISEKFWIGAKRFCWRKLFGLLMFDKNC